MKKILSLLTVLLLLAALCIPCLAFSLDECRIYEDPDTAIPLVVDGVGIFTDEEFERIGDEVKAISDTYGVGYVLLISDDNDGKSMELFAADFLYDNGYDAFGGSTVFYLSLEPNFRGWRTISIGDNENIFTYNVIYNIDETVDGMMRAGDYSGAFFAQVRYVETVFAEYREKGSVSGDSYEYHDYAYTNYDNYIRIGNKMVDKEDLFGIGIFSAIVWLIISGATVSSMTKKMKVNRPVNATQYLDENSVNITRHNVRYLYSTVTKTPRSQNRSGGGGGSSFGGGHASGGGHFSGGGRNF